MYLRNYIYILLAIPALTISSTSASDQKVVEYIDNQSEQSELTASSEQNDNLHTIISEVIATSESSSETVGSETIASTVSSKIIEEVESEISQNWIVSDGDEQNGEREIIVDDHVVLSETIENSKVTEQKDYYRNGQVANEIIYNQSSKYIYSYDSNGVLIDSKQYNGNMIVEHCVYDKFGQLANKTRYYSDYQSYIEFDSDGNKTLFLKIVDDQIVERITYNQDGSMLTDEMLYRDGSVMSLRNYDQAGLPIEEFGYSKNGKLEYQTYFKDGFIDYVDYYYSDEESVKERLFYESGYKLESKFYSHSGLYVGNQTYYQSGEGRGQLRAKFDFNSQGDTIESNHYNREGNLYRTKLYTEDGIIEEEINYLDDIISWRKNYDDEGIVTKKYVYYQDGSVRYQEDFEDGIRTKRQYFDTAKNLTRLDEYSHDGEGYQQVTKYYQDGTISTVYTYYNGKTMKRKLEYTSEGKLEFDKRYNQQGQIEYKYYYDDDQQKVQKRTYADGQQTRDDYFIDEIRRSTYIYNQNGSYTKTYYAVDQTKIRRDYYNKKGQRYRVKSYLETEKRSGYTTKKVKTCNMGTTREANVVVDIGVDSDYANRDYYAYTNKYGQLVAVDAAQIIRQNETFEDVVLGSNGKASELRYCKTEAQVTDSEDSKYDRGHVIADSMGGAANAYNITPQIEEINLYGAQYLMETMFRQAFVEGKTVTNFSMKISYKNSKTNIPSKYSVSFEIDGEKHSYTANNE